jgi:hypothetical protein
MNMYTDTNKIILKIKKSQLYSGGSGLAPHIVLTLPLKKLLGPRRPELGNH